MLRQKAVLVKIVAQPHPNFSHASSSDSVGYSLLLFLTTRGHLCPAIRQLKKALPFRTSPARFPRKRIVIRRHYHLLVRKIKVRVGISLVYDNQKRAMNTALQLRSEGDEMPKLAGVVRYREGEAGRVLAFLS